MQSIVNVDEQSQITACCTTAFTLYSNIPGFLFIKKPTFISLLLSCVSTLGAVQGHGQARLRLLHVLGLLHDPCGHRGSWNIVVLSVLDIGELHLGCVALQSSGDPIRNHAWWAARPNISTHGNDSTRLQVVKCAVKTPGVALHHRDLMEIVAVDLSQLYDAPVLCCFKFSNCYEVHQISSGNSVARSCLRVVS